MCVVALRAFASAAVVAVTDLADPIRGDRAYGEVVGNNCHRSMAALVLVVCVGFDRLFKAVPVFVLLLTGDTPVVEVCRSVRLAPVLLPLKLLLVLLFTPEPGLSAMVCALLEPGGTAVR